MKSNFNVRIATMDDTNVIGKLLYDFNTEYHEPTPTPAELSARFKFLLDSTDTAVILGGAGPDGLAVLRFRPSIWSQALECYLAELYVKPAKRGQGLGRAILTEAIQLARSRGADYMDLGTSQDDVAARKLYESAGFSNREGHPDGPIMYVYEREI